MMGRVCLSAPALCVLVAGSLVLAACSTALPPSSLGDDGGAFWRAEPASAPGFDAEGRLAVQDEGKGSYANFAWQDAGSVQNLEVKTPLGNSVGVLCQDALGVIARDSGGRVVQADSVAQLSEQMLGVALPFDHLNQWVKGYRVGGEPYQLLPDGQLRQSGWLIRRELAPDQVAPKRLELSNARFQIRLVFDDYAVVPAAAVAARCDVRSQAGQ